MKFSPTKVARRGLAFCLALSIGFSAPLPPRPARARLDTLRPTLEGPAQSGLEQALSDDVPVAPRARHWKLVPVRFSEDGYIYHVLGSRLRTGLKQGRFDHGDASANVPLYVSEDFDKDILPSFARYMENPDLARDAALLIIPAWRFNEAFQRGQGKKALQPGEAATEDHPGRGKYPFFNDFIELDWVEHIVVHLNTARELSESGDAAAAKLHAYSGNLPEWRKARGIEDARELDLERRSAPPPAAGVEETAKMVEELRRVLPYTADAGHRYHVSEERWKKARLVDSQEVVDQLEAWGSLFNLGDADPPYSQFVIHHVNPEAVLAIKISPDGSRAFDTGSAVVFFYKAMRSEPMSVWGKLYVPPKKIVLRVDWNPPHGDPRKEPGDPSAAGVEAGEWPGPIDPLHLNFFLHKLVSAINQAFGSTWPRALTLDLVMDVLREIQAGGTAREPDPRESAEWEYFLAHLPYLLSGTSAPVPGQVPAGNALASYLECLISIAAVAALLWKEGFPSTEMNTGQMTDRVMMRLYQATSPHTQEPPPRSGTLEAAAAAMDQSYPPDLQRRLVSRTMQVLRGLPTPPDQIVEEQAGLEHSSVDSLQRGALGRLGALGGGRVAPAVPSHSSVLVFTDPETFDLAPLAVQWGRTIAVRYDGPEIVALEQLLIRMPGSKGGFAVGIAESDRLLQKAPNPVQIQNRRHAFLLLGLRWDNLPHAVAAGVEAVRAYLDTATAT